VYNLNKFSFTQKKGFETLSEIDNNFYNLTFLPIFNSRKENAKMYKGDLANEEISLTEAISIYLIKEKDHSISLWVVILFLGKSSPVLSR